MSLKVRPRARVVGMYTGAARLGQKRRTSHTRGGRRRAMGLGRTADLGNPKARGMPGIDTDDIR
jgi:hypothetical protein